MTPEAQRIAIAEAHLDKRIVADERGVPDCFYEVFPYDEGYCPQPFYCSSRDGWLRRIEISNYLSDLNAMHEAEKVLTKDQLHQMWHTLVYLARRDNFEPFHATAAQRAEAFLRTLNLWKD